MASRVQKIKFWDTFKNAKSVILHFFPVAEIGRNIHLLYFSYPQQIYSQFVEWGKKVLSPYSPQWSVYFPVLLLLITRKHPVYGNSLTGIFKDPCKPNCLLVKVWGRSILYHQFQVDWLYLNTCLWKCCIRIIVNIDVKIGYLCRGQSPPITRDNVLKPV